MDVDENQPPSPSHGNSANETPTVRNRHALKLKPDRDPGTRPDERAVPPTSEIEARLSGAHDLLREIDGDSQPEDRTRIDRQHTRCEPTAMPRPRPATDDLRVLRASLLADSSTSDSSTDDFRIGDFQILEELGRGGMGVVYHAIQSSLGRHVALKLLSDSYGSSSRAQERFEREARAAALLQHPNIAAVYGSGSVDGVDYIVMQYIKGKTLDRVIRDRAAARFQQHDDPPLNHVHADGSSKDDQSAIDDGSNEDLIASYDGNFSSLNSDSLRDHWTFLADLGRQAASALHHAHQQGIVHRDIKPSNLMLQEEGLLWVTDFGLAKSTQQDDLTETGEWVGTMRYVSPEQFRGDAEPRSDLFSLGITLYELATLRPAYRDVDPARLTQRILTGDVPSLLRACPEIPRDLATIVDKCIRTEPKDRYESAEALREDFQRFLNHQPIRARQISPFERLGKWVRRQPAIATLLATLFLTLILGVLVASYQWRETASALELARQRAIAAEESEQVATEHLQQARKTVSDFLGRIAQRRLISIPGMEQLRHDLLKDALEYHREFVDRYQDDDRLQSELAESLYYISDLEGQLSGSVDLKDSESLRQAMDIFERLRTENPNDDQYTLWFARCMELKSRLARRSDARESLRLLGTAKAMLTPQVGRDDVDPFAADLMGMVLQQIGLYYESLGDEASMHVAMENYTRAIEMMRLLEPHPEYAEKQTPMLATLYRDVGIIHRRLGDYADAEKSYDLASSTLDNFIQKYPNDVHARHSLASVSNTIGFFHGSGKPDPDIEMALHYFSISEVNYRWLARRSPTVVHLQDGWARALHNMGDANNALQEYATALQQRQQAAKIREELVNQNPDAPHLRSSWALSLGGVACTLREMKRYDESLATHQLAARQHALAVAADPNQPVLRRRAITGIKLNVRTLLDADLIDSAISRTNDFDDFQAMPESRFAKGLELLLIADILNSHIDESEKDSIQRTKLKKTQARCIRDAKQLLTKSAMAGFPIDRAWETDASVPDLDGTEIGADAESWIAELTK